MSKPPTISVLLPVRNGSATMGRALASIQAQTRTDWELLAVDDGSEDATREIIGAAAREDQRIKLIEPGRVGLVAALNAGLAQARGEFIARMDADDESYPDRLAAQAGLLESSPEIGLASCLVDFGGNRATSEGYARHVDWLNSVVTPDDLARSRFIESPLAHPSVMFRRSLVTAHGGYRAGDFPEDYELWIRWLEAGVRMTKVPRVLLAWHDAPGRMSRTDPRYSPGAFYRLKAGYLARWLRREQPGRAVWVWGAGRPTRQRARHLEAHGVRIEGFIDVDRKKTDRSVGGVPVIEPSALPAAGTIFVLGYVGTRGARELIRSALIARGYVETKDFLMCA